MTKKVYYQESLQSWTIGVTSGSPFPALQLYRFH